MDAWGPGWVAVWSSLQYQAADPNRLEPHPLRHLSPPGPIQELPQMFLPLPWPAYFNLILLYHSWLLAIPTTFMPQTLEGRGVCVGGNRERGERSRPLRPRDGRVLGAQNSLIHTVIY